MEQRKKLEKDLERIKEQVKEAEARLGAHSVKPVLMQRLFELEEERDVLLSQLQSLPSDA